MSDIPEPFSTPPVSDPPAVGAAPNVNGTRPPGPPAETEERADDAREADLLREVTLTVRALEEVDVRLATIELQLIALVSALCLAAIIIWKVRQP